jgi:tetratricopeptide (TPR) repeat protein
LPIPGLAQSPGVDSPEFHLELGHLYERFQDSKSAVEHFVKVEELAKEPSQRMQAQLALGRVKESKGDEDGAIDAYERALAELAKAGSALASSGPGSAGAAGSDAFERAARLYLKAGKLAKAQQLCDEHGAAFTDPWQKQRLVALELDVRRAMGTLDAKLAELEKVVAEDPPDEAALRFLALAYGGETWGPTAAPSAGSAGAAPDAKLQKQVKVYEKLHRLHPEDLQVRRVLLGLLERVGRIDDAVALASAAAAAGAGPECFLGPGPIGGSPALTAAADGIRIRLRAGQKDVALALTAKLIAQNKRDALAARLVAAQLYSEQERVDLAERALTEAAHLAATSDDVRKAAFAREQFLASSGRKVELQALYEEWLESNDPCFRVIAAQRRQQSLTSSAPSMQAPPLPR